MQPVSPHISDILSSLPENPGVYQFYDKDEKLLYVGKAKSLRNRVRSYFNSNIEFGKVAVLVKRIYDIKIILVETEFDALLLENSLIKKHQPPFNVMLKDDKTYPWICIKKERFPRVFITRKLIKDGSQYFGPYPSGKMMHTMMELIHHLYKLRNCNLNLTEENIKGSKFRICLEFHIGNCKGPCEAHQSESDYNQNISEIKNILKGNISSVTQHLKELMNNHSANFEFEKAQGIKEKIESLENYQSKSTVVSPVIHNVDVFTILTDEKNGYVNFMKVLNGAIIQAHTIELKKKLDVPVEELLQIGIAELRTRFGSDSNEIIIPFPINFEFPNVEFVVPKIGDKKKLLELSERNLKYYLMDRQRQEEKTDPERHSKRILLQLQTDLHLKEFPTHIECFDNSNFQGEAAVAACVVFKKGKPSKKDYRHFNIQTVTGPNDFASMEEVIFRRYKRMTEELQSLPQLIIVDGGKGQLSSAITALEKLNLKGKIPVIGIAKKLEEIYFPGDSLPLYIDKKSESLRLIQNLRNEAHRFGITHHRKKQEKLTVKSELDGIKGIGESTLKKLLQEFKSVKRVREADFTELSKAVGKSKAEIVSNYFVKKLIHFAILLIIPLSLFASKLTFAGEIPRGVFNLQKSKIPEGVTGGKIQPALHIYKASSKIKIDGELNEPDWQKAEAARDFYQNFPADTSYSLTKTEAFVTYDEEFFYVAAICYDSIKGDYVIQSLKRDFSYPVSDAFAVYIDPFNDKSNGFCFGVNPLGVQREGVLENGGSMGVTTNWDNRWFSEVKRYEDRWILEMAIPFKSIRFNEGMATWGINFSRNELKLNENSSWSPVPRNFNIGSLAYAGILIWDASPKKSGKNISLIPYAIGSVNEDFINDSLKRYKPNAGMDAKIAVTSALNLDLTINPDFSQVEVDRQVTNLTRFSLFFPEKRQFFIENSDLFSQFGFRQIRPFFSRRIGLFEKNGTNYKVPIIAGARLSGKLDENWRIGAMDMQTERDSYLGQEAQNYAVIAFQRKVFSRSNIAGIFVNRQGFRNEDMMANEFNRVAGIDYNLASADNKWFGKFFYHQSFSPGMNGNSGGTGGNLKKGNPFMLNDNYSHASFLLFSTRRIFAEWNHEYVGKNYLAEVGYVPHIENYNSSSGKIVHLSYWRLEPEISYKFYPSSRYINYHGPALYSSIYLDSAFHSTESISTASYLFKFINSGELSFEIHKHFTKLFFPTDILQTGGNPLEAGHYHYNMMKLNFQSNQRKKLNTRVSARYGEFYNGYFSACDGDIFLRLQPWGILGLSYSIDDIHLPYPYSNATLILVGPSVEVSFSKSLFLTTFLQYNTQADNLNLNGRFQWRFKPMSDFFLVYSDNYDSMLGKKNRALVLKFVYWFSL